MNKIEWTWLSQVSWILLIIFIYYVLFGQGDNCWNRKKSFYFRKFFINIDHLQFFTVTYKCIFLRWYSMPPHYILYSTYRIRRLEKNLLPKTQFSYVSVKMLMQNNKFSSRLLISSIFKYRFFPFITLYYARNIFTVYRIIIFVFFFLVQVNK